jgi:hypothetical protein
MRWAGAEMAPTIGRRMTFLALGAAGLVAYMVTAPQVPHTQTVHYILGDAAPRVDELRVRYAPYAPAPGHAEMAEDWTREVAFRFADGGAPRIVTHEPRLADGDYVVEIEIVSRAHANTTAKSRASLVGDPTSLDVSSVVPQ